MAGDDVGMTQMMAEDAVGDSVTIEKVDGGFIISWSEAVVMPEDKRQGSWDSFRIVRRKAVREDLARALRFLEEILKEAKVKGSKWGLS